MPTSVYIEVERTLFCLQLNGQIYVYVQAHDRQPGALLSFAGGSVRLGKIYVTNS